MTQGATESFTYDKDQNLTEDGSFEYAYDAENRLIEVLPAEDDPNNLTTDDKKLVFAYDYVNRRVRKLVYAWDPNEGESGDWSATAEMDLRFIYHERLLLLELDGLDSNAKVRKHVWGPGTDGRLGGLNSLLAIRDLDSTTNYVCFNNGTGSVAQLLDRSDGSVDAKYVYDTRGDAVRNTGTYAAENPLRYNGWYFDAEFDYVDTTCDGMYCSAMGYYYLPRLGRRMGGESAPIPGARVEVPFDPPDPPGYLKAALGGKRDCLKFTFRIEDVRITDVSYEPDNWICALAASFAQGRLASELQEERPPIDTCAPLSVCENTYGWLIITVNDQPFSYTHFTAVCTIWFIGTLDAVVNIEKGECSDVSQDPIGEGEA